MYGIWAERKKKNNQETYSREIMRTIITILFGALRGSRQEVQSHRSLKELSSTFVRTCDVSRPETKKSASFRSRLSRRSASHRVHRTSTRLGV